MKVINGDKILEHGRPMHPHRLSIWKEALLMAVLAAMVASAAAFSKAHIPDEVPGVSDNICRSSGTP